MSNSVLSPTPAGLPGARFAAGAWRPGSHASGDPAAPGVRGACGSRAGGCRAHRRGGTDHLRRAGGQSQPACPLPGRAGSRPRGSGGHLRRAYSRHGGRHVRRAQSRRSLCSRGSRLSGGAAGDHPGGQRGSPPAHPGAFGRTPSPDPGEARLPRPRWAGGRAVRRRTAAVPGGRAQPRLHHLYLGIDRAAEGSRDRPPFRRLPDPLGRQDLFAGRALGRPRLDLDLLRYVDLRAFRGAGVGGPHYPGRSCPEPARPARLRGGDADQHGSFRRRRAAALQRDSAVGDHHQPRRRSLAQGARRPPLRAGYRPQGLQLLWPFGRHHLFDRGVDPARGVSLSLDRPSARRLLGIPGRPRPGAGSGRRARRAVPGGRRVGARLSGASGHDGRPFRPRPLRGPSRGAHVRDRRPHPAPPGRRAGLPGPPRSSGQDPWLPGRAGGDRGGAGTPSHGGGHGGGGSRARRERRNRGEGAGRLRGPQARDDHGAR